MMKYRQKNNTGNAKCFALYANAKIVHVHILVPLCTCRMFYNRLPFSRTKKKDVTASRNDCRNDPQNRVQYDENISKIKKKNQEVHHPLDFQEKYYFMLNSIVDTF